MRRSLSRWLPLLAWMGLIFVLSAQPDLPQAPGPWLDTLLKKTGHAGAYGVLAWLYQRALRARFRGSTALRVVSVGLAVVYGLSDEYHQTFVPGRNGRLSDVAVDGVGACGAMLLDWWLERRRALPRQMPGAR
jgi:VanZ family protein